MNALFREAERRAIKDHICTWCGESIATGDEYIAIAQIWEGDFNYNKFHPECKAACDELSTKEDHFEYFEGDFVRGTTTMRY